MNTKTFRLEQWDDLFTEKSGEHFCKACKHKYCWTEEENKRCFLIVEDKIIGRQRIVYCKDCDCEQTTYIEFWPSEEETVFWHLASHEEPYSKYVKRTLTKEELQALIKSLHMPGKS